LQRDRLSWRLLPAWCRKKSNSLRIIRDKRKMSSIVRPTTQRAIQAWILAIACCLGPVASQAGACPFCEASGPTLAEQIAAADVVVIATLQPVAPDADADCRTFRIVETLKGRNLLGRSLQIEKNYFGEEPDGSRFYITANQANDLFWLAPNPLTDRSVAYLRSLSSLPPEGPGRLAFFQRFLEDREQLLSDDAYGEFARASYASLKDFKSQIQHDPLLAWINAPATKPAHRRLYLTMLGVCGNESDLPYLERLMHSRDEDVRLCLDAAIACYLRLRGADGLAQVEEQFLNNPGATRPDISAAVQAIRFHGEEERVIPKDRLAASLRLLLTRPTLADLVIADLARWQDWSALPTLVALFKQADGETAGLRVPIVQYVKACPQPEAKVALQELSRIDPAAAKQSSPFFPMYPPKPTADQLPNSASSGGADSARAPTSRADR